MRREYFYRHYAAAPNGETEQAYVGISVDPGQRTTDHGSEKEYWPVMRLIEVTPFREGTTRAEALAYERHVIRSERPPFNEVGNPDWDALQWKRDWMLSSGSAQVVALGRWKWKARRWLATGLRWAFHGAWLLAAFSAGLVWPS